MTSSPSEMDVWATIIIRALNFFLWTILTIRILRQSRPVYGLVRSLIMSVVLLGMGVLLFGALSPLQLYESGTARLVYTIFTAYAAFVAVGILLGPMAPDEGEDDPHLPPDPPVE